MASEKTCVEVRSGSAEDPKEKASFHTSNPYIHKLLLASMMILFVLKMILLSVPSIILFQKYSQHLEENITVRGLFQTELECVKDTSTTQEKVWSCCPKNWKSFSSRCYFISTLSTSWNKSKESCSRRKAHLVVINSQEEQDFIVQNLQADFGYYIGLSDPEGRRHWQWVDHTPYNKSATFWHEGEPNNGKERCVELNYYRYGKWGWNDVPCLIKIRSVCEMMKISLEVA
ncbi:C-type lectin domain family 4 member A-like [Octodon degus]|uniref:C-type lectin domain family 4 member A-like n=1 Tax=Octodon degus TaxID=10160 RepID=A0A6P6E2C1_OCTDE|nr:C-type lectin domain family 4 member A-like [Octodon degus]